METSKTTQQPTTGCDATVEGLQTEIERLQQALEQAQRTPTRTPLPDTRQSITHKFSISGHEGYISVGLYADGRPGEMFLTMAKEGSTVGGLMDTIGVLTSLALQYGVPVSSLARKFEHSRFEPSGHTTNPDHREASSIVDYVFTWLDRNFTDDSGPDLAADSFPSKPK